MAAVHRFPVRIYYEDTDAGGVVYYANYLRYMERARTEMLRDKNIHLSEMAEKDGLLFVVGEVNARYKASARLDDQLVVETTVTAIGGASLKLVQNVLKPIAEGDSLLLEGTVTLVLITREGKPARLPQTLRHAFAA